MNSESPKLVILDLDGTLVHSAPNLALGLNRVLEDLGYPETDLKHVMSHMGNGMHQLISNVFGDIMESQIPDKVLKDAYTSFLNYYAQDATSISVLYPNVVDTLATLAKMNIKIACVTNKLAAYTVPMVEYFEINQYFSLVLSGDSLSKKKPDSLPLTYACELLGVKIEESLMVGDSEVDVHSAINAGMRSVYMNYGYGNNCSVAKLKPDYSLEKFTQLLEVV